MDGNLLVSRCHNCPCHDPSFLTKHGFGCDFQHTSKHEVGQYHLHCAAALELMEGLGGRDNVLDLFEQATPTQHCGEPIVIPLTPAWGREYVAVNPGVELETWGVVDVKHSICGVCPRNKSLCQHVGAISMGGDDAASDGRNVFSDPGVWNEAFDKVFDREEGKRKLTCISRLQIPEAMADDADVHRICKGYATGTCPFPSICKPISTEACCTSCGMCAWSEEMSRPDKPSLVFLRNAVVYTEFYLKKCTTLGCDGELTVDGKEYAVLRKSDTIALSYLLLYSWENDCGVKGETWFGFWRKALMDIVTHGDEQKREWIKNLYQPFQQATLDFLQLQKIDYRSGFCCPHGFKSVQVDGITLGCHKDKCCLTQPWLAQVASYDTCGSLFKDRTFVSDKRARNLLLQFSDMTKKQPPGLDASEMRQLEGLLAGMGPRGEALVQLVRRCGPLMDGKHRASAPYRELLYNLATTAPACMLMKPALWSTLEPLLGRYEQAGVGEFDLGAGNGGGERHAAGNVQQAEPGQEGGVSDRGNGLDGQPGGNGGGEQFGEGRGMHRSRGDRAQHIVTIEIVTIIKAANPALGRVVLSFLGRTLDDDIADVLRHMLKLARSSYAAAPGSTCQLKGAGAKEGFGCITPRGGSLP